MSHPGGAGLVFERVISLPNQKILAQSKLKALANDKINVAKRLKFGSGSAENIMGNGKNAGYKHFLHFPKCFQKPFSSWL